MRKKRKKSGRKGNGRDYYQEITDRIVSAMENDNIAPWHKPWKSNGVPRNAVTGRAYRGVNVFLTLLTQWQRGYDLPLWLTFNQANEISAKALKKAGHNVEQNDRGTWVFADGENEGKSVGGVRKGQSKKNGCGATEIVFWKVGRKTETDESGEEKERTWVMMRFFSVFNLEQCEDHVIEYLKPADPSPEFSPIDEAERICEAYEIEIKHAGDRAFYLPKEDRIVLPKRKAFHSPEHYYTTRFHEMGHSTGHASRLNRDGIADFDFKGSHQYAEEELVAEFTACFLAGAAGIVRTVEDSSAAYLKHWASKLKEDKKIVVRAAQRAQKAADLILDEADAAEEGEDEAA